MREQLKKDLAESRDVHLPLPIHYEETREARCEKKPVLKTRLLDDMLDFVIIRAVSRLTILALIRKYARGGAKDIRQILVRRGRELKVTCDRVSMINIDGERIDDTELSVRLSAKKVLFFFPEGTHWNPALRSRPVEIAR